MSKLNVALIGAGFISNYHIKGLRTAGADVRAISSRSQASAQAKAAEFEIPDFTTDNSAIFSRDDVDAVVIVTPDFTHKDIAVEALEAGKPVMLQKPMARSTDECLTIIETAKRTGTPLFVSFMHRYFEEVYVMRDLLAKQALGSIFSIRQRNATPGANWASWFFSKEKVGGGALMQLGVHGIDLLRYLFGEIVEVRATTALLKKERKLKDGTVVYPDSEDLVFATYRFESGALATHETIYNEVAGTDRFRMEIYGENGSAWLRTERGNLAVYAPDYLGQHGWLIPDLPPEIPGLRHHQHFIDMVTGEAPPDHSALDGLMSQAVVEAVYKAAETGNWVTVKRDW